MNLDFLDNEIPVVYGKRELALEDLKKFRKYCSQLNKKPSELTKKEIDKE